MLFCIVIGLSYWAGAHWRTSFEDQLMRDIREQHYEQLDLIDEYYAESGKEHLPTIKCLTYKRFQEAYNNSVKFQTRLQEEIELMVINGGLIDD